MVTKATLRPGQKGTKALTKKFGERLVCVRYKFDQETGRRYTTVELIEEETDCQPSAKVAEVEKPTATPRRVAIKVEYWEADVREKVKPAGGIWRPRHKLWEMWYEDIVALSLESRVVGGGPVPSL